MGTVFGVFAGLAILILILLVLYKRQQWNPAQRLTEESPIHFDNPAYVPTLDTVPDKPSIELQMVPDDIDA